MYYFTFFTLLLPIYLTFKFNLFKVRVGPNLSTNRNMKQIIATECTRTAIFQFLWPLDISKLIERAYTIIYHIMYLFFSRSNYVSNNMARNRKKTL